MSRRRRSATLLESQPKLLGEPVNAGKRNNTDALIGKQPQHKLVTSAVTRLGFGDRRKLASRNLLPDSLGCVGQNLRLSGVTAQCHRLQIPARAVLISVVEEQRIARFGKLLGGNIPLKLGYSPELESIIRRAA